MKLSVATLQSDLHKLLFVNFKCNHVKILILLSFFSRRMCLIGALFNQLERKSCQSHAFWQQENCIIFWQIVSIKSFSSFFRKGCWFPAFALFSFSFSNEFFPTVGVLKLLFSLINFFNRFFCFHKATFDYETKTNKIMQLIIDNILS